MNRPEPPAIAGRGSAAKPAPWTAPLDLAAYGEPAARWEGRPVASWRTAWRVPALVVYRLTESTNDVARRLADAGAPAGTVVLADEQSAGRGRGGRVWVAPPRSSLLLSVVLRPAGRPDEIGPAVTPLHVGLAVARAVEGLVPRPAAIKWPNDVLIDGRKVAGILCEAAAGGPAGDFIIAGIGINVAQRPDDWPPVLRSHATSLAAAAGAKVARHLVASRLMAALVPRATLSPGDLAPEDLAEITRRDALFGHDIAVDGRPAGTASGIAADGTLVVRTPGGGRRHVRAGTIRIING